MQPVSVMVFLRDPCWVHYRNDFIVLLSKCIHPLAIHCNNAQVQTLSTSMKIRQTEFILDKTNSLTSSVAVVPLTPHSREP